MNVKLMKETNSATVSYIKNWNFQLHGPSLININTTIDQIHHLITYMTDYKE